jgi:hypothetical protein
MAVRDKSLKGNWQKFPFLLNRDSFLSKEIFWKTQPRALTFSVVSDTEKKSYINF